MAFGAGGQILRELWSPKVQVRPSKNYRENKMVPIEQHLVAQ